MIRQVCIYCNKDLGSIEEPGIEEERVSHGLCADCIPRLVEGNGEHLADFLDSLPAPVFMLDQDGRVAAANARGQQLVSKGPGEVQGRLAGEVFSCKYSKLPGGCGQTVHCKTCTIRKTVAGTFESGRPSIRIPAYMDLGDIVDVKTTRFLISTEKVGSGVLLRIDDAQPADSAGSEEP
jgi:PAS domain-containing protein